MQSQTLRDMVSHVRQIASAAPDLELLGRFLDHGDEAAYGELVRRYGGLVRGVCRRLLADGHDIEDAVQATFLVLARAAGSIRTRASIGCWLHGVAFRIAHGIRRQRDRRRTREVPLADVPAPACPDDVSWREVRAVLDEELSRLPEDLRAPLVLCYLQGLTRDEAARKLGWATGRLKFRLERARAALRQRLQRRGVTLSAPLLAVLLSESADAAAPIVVNMPAALAAARGHAIDTLVSASVAALVRAALPSTVAAKFGNLAATLTVVLAGFFALAWGLDASRDDPANPPVVPVATQPAPLARNKTPEVPPPEKFETRADKHEALYVFQRVFSLKLENVVADAGAYHPDGERYALAKVDEITLHDDATGKELLRFTGGHRNRITQLVYSPDGATLASIAYHSDVVKLWDVRTGKEIRTFSPGAATVIRVAFVGGGKRLAAVTGRAQWEAFGGDGALRMWETATGKEVLAIGKLPRDLAKYAAFSDNGRRLAMTSRSDADVRVWDLDSGKLLWTLPGVTDDKSPQAVVALSGDGEKLATTQPLTKGLAVYTVGKDAASANLQAKMAAEGLAFSPTGELLAWGSTVDEDATGKTTIRGQFQVFTPAEPKRKPYEASYGPSLNGVAFRPDGQKLLLLFTQEPDKPAPKKEGGDLRKAFQDACSAVLALEAKHAVLRGISLAEPPPCQMTNDARGLKSAEFRFARNTTNGGKPPRPAEDPAQPHFDVLVNLWRAEASAQPPGGQQTIHVHGVDYGLNIMVGGSNAELVRRVRGIFEKAFDRWMGPSAP
jgi:RNA polymerase sigma factor (sigma-70 family)